MINNTKHIHIPILKWKGHVHWIGENPPSKKQMDAFEEMGRLALEYFETNDKS